MKNKPVCHAYDGGSPIIGSVRQHNSNMLVGGKSINFTGTRKLSWDSTRWMDEANFGTFLC